MVMIHCRRTLLSTLTLFMLIFCGQPAHAQQYEFTSNKYVEAKVNKLTGHVIIGTTANGFYGDQYKALTFGTETSYLSVEIDGKVYTNNNQYDLPFATDPRFGGYLVNATTRRVRGQGAGQFGYADTIETTWKLPVGDLIQQVYPIEFDFSGQIVLAWKFRNRGQGTQKRVQAQYLLDTKIRGNDQAKVLTRSGYRRQWTFYAERSGTFPPVPAFFQAFQQDLQPPKFDPILASQGTLEYPELGLIKPDAVMIGQWDVLIRQLWSYPNPWPSDEYTDSGVLMIFPAAYAFGSETITLGRTAYGTGEYESCTGDLYALIFRPRKLRANAAGDDYKPNPFTVDLYLFNTNEFTEAGNTIASLEVGPYLKIVDPPGATNNGTFHTQYSTPRVVGVGGVSVATWKVHAEKTCSGDTTWLQITTKSTLGDPSFNQTCRLPLAMPCLDKDTLPPIAEPELNVQKFLKTVEFHDDRQKDKGIDKIEAINYDPAKIKVVIDAFQRCRKENWVKVSATHLDTAVEACVTFRVTDCAGNITHQDVCFPPNPPVPDTVKPIINFLGSNYTYDGTTCNAKYDTLIAVDEDLFDLGLKSIDYTPGKPPVNMQLVMASMSPGASRHGFSVVVLDSFVDGSISIRATDLAGNFSDYELRYCTFPDTNRPTVTVFQINPYEWSVFVEDERPYDRRIDTIDVYNRQNVALRLNGLDFEPSRDYTRWQAAFSFNVVVVDTSKFASWCVRAKDLADSSNVSNTTKWWSADTCLSRDTIKDTWIPNISLNPPPAISPTVIDVTIDDIHYVNGQRVGWDKGIDSIWFTNVKGMEVPSTIVMQCADKITFQVKVADTLAMDDRATICINVIDCAGNRNDTCWYYPIIPDSLPPIIQGVKATQTQLDMVVTDSTTYDRGLRTIVLKDHDNFLDVTHIDTTGSVLRFPLEVRQPGRSAVGRLEAIDVFGMQAPASSDQRAFHTAYIDVAIWVQDVEFKKSILAKQNETIKVPVNFVKNDTFSLYRKGIKEFEFSFDMTGHPGFTYAGYDIVGTATEGWTINEAINGNRITLRGSSGNPMSLQDSAMIYILIKSAEDELTREVKLTTTGVLFNQGRDTIVYGKNSVAILPAPYGKITGGNLVAAGSCAPAVEIGANTPPKSIFLEHARPNPFRDETKLHFSVAKEGPVSIVLYNSLGQPMKTVVDEYMQPGYYSVRVTSNGLAGGSYYVRMQSEGKVTSRNLRLEK
jgi:hypothetical protein